MEKKLGPIQRIAISGFLALLLCGWGVNSSANPASASNKIFRQWLVQSEYLDPVSNRVSKISWRFVAVDKTGQGFRVEVRDSLGRVGNWADFHFSSAGRLEEWIDYRLVRGGRVETSRRLFEADRPALVEPALVPGDWPNLEIPFKAENGSWRYTVYKQAGPARFVDKLELRKYSVSPEEAVARGWIRNDNRTALSGQLSMVEVSRLLPDGKKELVFRQLWPLGGDFWLFEEHGRRRSWLSAE